MATASLDAGGHAGHIEPDPTQRIRGWKHSPQSAEDHTHNVAAVLLREKEHAFASHPWLRQYRSQGVVLWTCEE